MNGNKILRLEGADCIYTLMEDNSIWVTIQEEGRSQPVDKTKPIYLEIDHNGHATCELSLTKTETDAEDGLTASASDFFMLAHNAARLGIKTAFNGPDEVKKNLVELLTINDVEWTSENAAAADAEGWGIFSTNVDGPFQLQKSDEHSIFTADHEAWEYVRLNAAANDFHSIAALAYLKEKSPDEYQRVMGHEIVQRWAISASERDRLSELTGQDQLFGTWDDDSDAAAFAFPSGYTWAVVVQRNGKVLDLTVSGATKIHRYVIEMIDGQETLHHPKTPGDFYGDQEETMEWVNVVVDDQEHFIKEASNEAESEPDM